MRLIDADALWKDLELSPDDWAKGRVIKMYIDDAPTVDAEPVRRGEWIEKPTVIKYISHWECSACNSWQGANWMNYCPNCGAKMDGKDTNVPTKGRRERE